MNPATDTRFSASGPCPACLEPAHLVIADAYFSRSSVNPADVHLGGRVVEVRHATPTGGNNCGGIL